MKKIAAVTIVFLCFFAPLCATGSDALYKYIDKDGTPCYADNLQVIPEQYRASAVMVGEESSGPAKTHMSSTADSEKQSVSSERQTAGAKNVRPLSFRVLISVCIVAASALLFGIANKTTRLHENRKLYSILRAALAGGLSIYLLVAHLNDVATLFHMANAAVDDVEQQSAEKGKKAAQAIKKLDEMFESAAQRETQRIQQQGDSER